MPTDRRTAAAKAERLRQLHTPSDPLIVANVWDVASARVIAALPGASAVATSSWAISAGLGIPDGENLTVDQVLGTVTRISEAVDLPVTADLERGYGRTPDDVGVTVSRLLTVGAVGCNIEDSVGDQATALTRAATEGEDQGGRLVPHGERGMRDLGEQVERLLAARESADRLGVPLVINARTDSLVLGGTVDDAIRRGLAYLDAGADCVFVLGIRNLPAVRLFVDAFEGRVNVLARPDMPALPELAEAGVCRISFGPGLMGLAYAALGRAASQLLSRGTYPPDLAKRPPVT